MFEMKRHIYSSWCTACGYLRSEETQGMTTKQIQIMSIQCEYMIHEPNIPYFFCIDSPQYTIIFISSYAFHKIHLVKQTYKSRILEWLEDSLLVSSWTYMVSDEIPKVFPEYYSCSKITREKHVFDSCAQQPTRPILFAEATKCHPLLCSQKRHARRD